jgi:AraC-like DNA-binding protein
MLVRRPPPPLSSFVDCLWHLERDALAHGRERMLPTGEADIVIPLRQPAVLRYDDIDAAEPRRLRGGVVVGPHDRWFVRGTGGASSVVGVHFRPGGAAAFFGGALPSLRNRTELLDDLWGPSACELRERLQAAGPASARLDLLQAHLLRRLHASPGIDPMAAWALHALQRDPAAARIDAVQQASGCSPAGFIRRFESSVGLTPKRYARVLRFGSLLPALVRQGPRDWAQVAAGGGYFDQSHLIHEFRRLAGITPGAYVPVQPDQPNHVVLTEKISNTRIADQR